MINNNGQNNPDGSLPVYTLTGAGGHLGGLVLNYLLDQVPAKQIIAATRCPELLADFTAQGVAVRRADFNDPSSLPEAFSGAARLLIISTNEYPMEKRSAQDRAAISAAVKAGIRHITITSFSLSKAADEDDENPWLRGRRQTMETLAGSGAEWTVLNMNIWMAGVPYFLNALRIGEQVLVQEGSGKPCWITHEDYASTAVSVLTGKALFSGAVDVTGPESLGIDDIARRWSDLHSRKLEVQILPGREVIERLASNGMLLESAHGIASYCEMFRLFDVRVSDTVERATGTPPSTVDRLLQALSID